MAPALGRSSVASIASSVDLPAPFGPSRPRMAPRARDEGDAGQRAPPAEMAGDVVDRDVVEVETCPERRRGSRGDALAASLRPGAHLVQLAVDLLELG